MYDEMTEVRERQRRKQLVRAYSRMIAGQIRLGKEASFVNFMFNQLPGGVAQHKEIMTREVRRVHDILSRSVVRKPNSDTSKRDRKDHKRDGGDEKPPVSATDRAEGGDERDPEITTRI